ncbi:hypothetical protein [Limosilactobacillus reuteri]|jgi:hypothetical protein|uniref:Uncharacterized protein n=1 Tax=Limosilactobacillus reuteri TaxID=1598 RepID=A0AB36AFL5_LIMRT|nr:hypothetical protein [Limosilactobacillus reuteri]MRG84196.1 hypothetical protein [Limosilactobacillus reuteri]
MKPSEERKRILHKRWAIAIVIAAIIATLLHIWYLVLAFIFIVGGTCLGLNLIIDVMSWLEGDDLRPDLKSKNKRPSDSGQENDISNTMWDIYTTDQIIKHSPYNNDDNFRNDNDFHDDDNFRDK